MRRTALDIFYSSNRFIIKSCNKSYKSPRLPAGRIEASLFLQGLVPTYTIHRLRSIEVVFSPFEINYLSSARYNDWLSTISHLAKHANLPNLTLKIRTTRGREGCYNSGYQSRWFTENQKERVLRMYRRLLTPLDELKGLGDLFLHLEWPLDRYLLALFRTTEVREHQGDELVEMERMLEQRVMGEQYDSHARGKDQWL
jgi:hypothetical protein